MKNDKIEEFIENESKKKNNKSIVGYIKQFNIIMLVAFGIIILITPFIITILFSKIQSIKVENIVFVVEQTTGVESQSNSENKSPLLNLQYLQEDVDDFASIRTTLLDVQGIRYVETTGTCDDGAKITGVQEHANDLSGEEYTFTFENGCELYITRDKISIGITFGLLFFLFFLLYVILVFFTYLNTKHLKNKIQDSVKELEQYIVEIDDVYTKTTEDGLSMSLVEFEPLVEKIYSTENEVKEFMHEKKVLLSTLNHELKSPVNRINSYIQAYEKKIPGYDDEEKMLNMIKAELADLSEIINTTLMIFSAASLSDYKLMSMYDLFQKKIDDYDKVPLEVEIKFINELNPEFKMLVRSVAGELIVSNLIENIVKYGKEEALIYMEDDVLYVKNKIRKTKSNSTKKGLSLSAELLKTSGHKLTHYVDGEYFVVAIDEMKHEDNYTGMF